MDICAIVPFADGKCDTIVAALKDVFDKKGIPPQKINSLGTNCIWVHICTSVLYLVKNTSRFYSIFQEVKDACWLSQQVAISTLRHNLCAALASLAEEVEMNRCPLAKGRYTFCTTYSFVAGVYIQVGVLSHLGILSRMFQKENVNFSVIKTQVH